MKLVYTTKKKKKQFSFYSHNKFLVPTLLTPLENNPGATTVHSICQQKKYLPINAILLNNYYSLYNNIISPR